MRKLTIVVLVLLVVAAVSIWLASGSWAYLSPNIPRGYIGEPLRCSAISSDRDGDDLTFRFVWIKRNNLTRVVKRDVLTEGVLIHEIPEGEPGAGTKTFRGSDIFTLDKAGSWEVRIYSSDGFSWSHEHIAGTRKMGDAWTPIKAIFPPFDVEIEFGEGWSLRAVVKLKAE